MKKLLWARVVCFQKYFAAIGLLSFSMIYQSLCASQETNPSQSSVELGGSSLITDTASHDFNLKIISSNGTDIKSSKHYSELARLIQFYHHLQTGPGRAELKFESDFAAYNVFHEDFNLKMFLEINDSKSFYLAISKVISVPLHACRFRLISSCFDDYDSRSYGLYTAVYVLIYSWAYSNALLRCDFKHENLDCKEMVESIGKTIEECCEFILMISPYSSSCISEHSKLIKGFGSNFVCHVLFNNTKMHIFKADPLIVKMESETCFVQESWKWENSKNGKQIARLREDYFALCEELHLPINKLKILGPHLFSDQLKEFLETLETLLRKFEESLMEVENTPEDRISSDHVLIIEFCRSKLTTYKSYYSNFETTGRKYEKLFKELDKVFQSIYDQSIRKALYKNYEMMENTSWIRELILFQSYCWETAHMINYNTEIAIAVADSVIEVLEQEDSIYFDKFIRKYDLYFSGIVKAICDRKLLPSDETVKLPSTRNIILKITHEKCGMRDLMNLYYAVKKEKLKKNELKMLINDLLRKLSDEGITKYDDIGKSTKECIPIMVYAVNILMFEILEDSSCTKRFPETFKEVIIYTLNLHRYIWAVVGDSGNPSTQIILEQIRNLFLSNSKEESSQNTS